MAKNSRNLKASWTLDIHEEAIWALYKTLELVGSGLLFGGGVQKIDRHILLVGRCIRGVWKEAELCINSVEINCEGGKKRWG